MTQKIMKAIDLFAGVGGFTEGAEAAGVEVVWTANHWPAAVAVHKLNHPTVQHACQDLQQADWRQVPAHDLLLASPACQGHSKARGKEKLHHDAMRNTAWAVINALECHRPPFGLVENVVEFTDWALYPAWVLAANALGYSVTPHVIDAADHGVPQNRPRVVIVLARSKQHLHLKMASKPHVGANTIIRFGEGKWSRVERPGRAPATLDRWRAGRGRHGHRFVMPYYSSGSGLTGRALDRPLGTITTVDRWAVVDGDHMRMLSIPEARAAMSFRDDYQLPATKRQAMHMLGNAFPPKVATDFILAVQQQG